MMYLAPEETEASPGPNEARLIFGLTAKAESGFFFFIKPPQDCISVLSEKFLNERAQRICRAYAGRPRPLITLVDHLEIATRYHTDNLAHTHRFDTGDLIKANTGHFGDTLTTHAHRLDVVEVNFATHMVRPRV